MTLTEWLHLQDRQSQGLVAAAPHCWHQSSCKTLEPPLPLDLLSAGGVLQTGAHTLQLIRGSAQIDILVISPVRHNSLTAEGNNRYLSELNLWWVIGGQGWPGWTDPPEKLLEQVAKEVHVGSDRKVWEDQRLGCMLLLSSQCLCWLWPTHQQWPHQNQTTEQQSKLAWSGSTTSRGWSVCVDHMEPGCTMERKQAAGGSMMVWSVFRWAPVLHVDVWHVPPTWALLQTMFTLSPSTPDVCGVEEHNKKSEVLTWLPKPPDLSPVELLWAPTGRT